MITQAFLTVGFFPFFCLFLILSGFLCQFLMFGTGFLVNFPPSVFFPIINLFEVPLDPQRFSSARTLSPCRATWIGMNNYSSVDFSCIICPDSGTDPCLLLSKIRISLGQALHLFCIFPGQSRAVECCVWATPRMSVLERTSQQSIQMFSPGWDFIDFNQRFYSQTRPAFCWVSLAVLWLTLCKAVPISWPEEWPTGQLSLCFANAGNSYSCLHQGWHASELLQSHPI